LLLLAQGGSTSVSRQPGLIDNAVGLVLSTMIAWLPVVAIALVLRHRGEGAATIGLGRFEPGRDTGAGLLLWIAGFLLVAYVLAPLFHFLGEHPPDLLPSSLPLWFRITEALAIGATAGITEEVVVRGYAQTRLEQLRLPTVLVVLLPTLLWGSLHLYEGLGGAITVFFLGLGYAIWFQRTRRLWPIVIAHGLFDLTSLALAIIYTKH
jgi:membrane protease YdiL (CAAX protease family)